MILKVFENHQVVALDKPVCVLSVPSRMQDKDSRLVLGTELQKQLGQQIYPVHRLDFEVSGLILFAKTQAAHKMLNQCFEEHTVIKEYQAVSQRTVGVAGLEKIQVGDRFEWKCKLLRGKKRAYESPHGKLSVTFAEIIKLDSAQIKWKLNPVTGRSHQLRYELYRHQTPIVGDQLYGAAAIETSLGIALRCVKMSFPESVTNEIGLPSSLEVQGL